MAKKKTEAEKQLEMLQNLQDRYRDRAQAASEAFMERMAGFSGAGEPFRLEENTSPLLTVLGGGVGAGVGFFTGGLPGALTGLSIGASFGHAGGSSLDTFNTRQRTLNQSYIRGSFTTAYSQAELEQRAREVGQIDDPANRNWFVNSMRWGRNALQGIPLLGFMAEQTFGRFDGPVGIGPARQTLEAAEALRLTGATPHQTYQVAREVTSRYGTEAPEYLRGMSPFFADPFVGQRFQNALDRGMSLEWATQNFFGNSQNLGMSIERFGLDATIGGINRAYRDDPRSKDRLIREAVGQHRDLASQYLRIDNAQYGVQSAISGLTHTLATGSPIDSPGARGDSERILRAQEALATEYEAKIASLKRQNQTDEQVQNSLKEYGAKLDEVRATLEVSKQQFQIQRVERAVGRDLAAANLYSTRAMGESLTLGIGEASGSLGRSAQEFENVARRMEGRIAAHPNLPEDVKEQLRQTAESSRYSALISRRQLAEQRTTIPAQYAELFAEIHPNDLTAYDRYVGRLETDLDAIAGRPDLFGPMDVMNRRVGLFHARRDRIARRGEAGYAFPAQEGIAASARAGQLLDFGAGTDAIDTLLKRAFEQMTQAEVSARNTYGEMTRSGLFSPGERAGQAALVEDLGLSLQALERQRAYLPHERRSEELSSESAAFSSERRYRSMLGYGSGFDIRMAQGTRTLALAEQQNLFEQAQEAESRGETHRARGLFAQGTALGFDADADLLSAFSTFNPTAKDRLQMGRIGLTKDLYRSNPFFGGQVPSEVLRLSIQTQNRLLGQIEQQIAAAPEGQRDAVAANLFLQQASLIAGIEEDRNRLRYGDIGRLINRGAGANGDFLIFGTSSGLPSNADHQMNSPGGGLRMLGGSGEVSIYGGGGGHPLDTVGSLLGGGNDAPPELLAKLDELIQAVKSQGVSGQAGSTPARTPLANSPGYQAQRAANGLPRL